MTTCGFDKDGLYGRYQKAEDWQGNLYRKAAHKSLDIPDQDMPINVRNGVGWKELLALGLLGITGVGGLSAVGGLAYLLSQRPQSAAEVPIDIDTDTKYEFDISAGTRPS